MAESIFIGLIQNIAVLLAFTALYEYFWNKNEDIGNYLGKFLAGITIGLVGIFLMSIPWIFREGLVFDMRSVLLAVSGLFFGAVPTVIAMAITALYRILNGGAGASMGVAVILCSGGIGLLWRHFFPPRKIRKPFWNLLLLGFFVHVAMLLCTFLLPKEEILNTMQLISLPLLLIYTPGTLLLGLLMLKRWSIWQIRKDKEENEKKYRALVENAGEGIAVSQDGYIRFANKQVEKITLYSNAEICSRPFLEFIHPEDSGRIRERDAEHPVKKEVLWRNSFRIIDKQGNIKWLESNAVLIDWEKRPAVLLFFNDMTAYRETQLQLQKSKERAEESDRLKSNFLANMSHEIRTPMNAIMGFSDLLVNADLPEEKKKEYLNLIRTSGIRLLRIINDIMDLSKIEAGSMKLYPAAFRLNDILEQSISAFRNGELLRLKSGLELRLRCPEELKESEFYSDAYRLQQVLDNLIENALKFTEKGFVEVGCSLQKAKSKAELQIYVKDSGPGIVPEKQTVIFERFRQAEEDQYHEGAGLGLSISRGIAELLGGNIRLESEPGAGSCFTLSIPVTAEGGMRKKKPVESAPKPDLRNILVLIAEDDLGSYYLLREYLKPCGADPIRVQDGEMLMNMLREKTPDLLLLDINLPIKNGYECLEEIKKQGYRMRIIAQTAYAMPDEKKRCFNAGCHGYIAKPFLPEDLYREIERVMKQKNRE
ncbi:MAG: ATP-binding protein [Candidatus Marinimicrobia bacterium]|nr:ATP-binding protein [Candidatus Neomarinimicrobiota bacterium]